MRILLLGANSEIAWELVLGLDATHPHSEFILAARDIASLEDKLQKISGTLKQRARPVYFDAADFSSHSQFCDQFVNSRFDLVILAFGYLGSQQAAQLDFSEAQRIINVNYVAKVSLLEKLSHLLIAQRKAAQILVLSSVASLRGRSSNHIYGSAKAGLNCYLQGLAARLSSHSIAVKIVLLGPVRTKMTKDANTPEVLLADKVKVAQSIISFLSNKKYSVFIPYYWNWLMKVIVLLPRFIFYRMKN